MSERRHPDHNITIGLSGPSSSGKTTLARLLRDVFNVTPEATTNRRSIKLFIFHEDDVYKTDIDIPYVTTPSGRRLQDWDSADAINLPLLESTLQHIHGHGTLPPELHQKEDQNTIGKSGVPQPEIQRHHDQVTTWLNTADLPSELKSITLCILDGFLLYSDPEKPSIPLTITDQLDLKLFIRTDHERTKTRREARNGYVTLEGFWKDPEGYVDEVVWPNYVRDHGWMFHDSDVDQGELVPLVEKQGISVGPGKGEKSMSELLDWSVDTIRREVNRMIRT